MAKFKKGNTASKGKGRPKGAFGKAPAEMKEWLSNFYGSEEYRTSLKKRITAGRAPGMEVYCAQLLLGKPKIVIEVPPPRTSPLSARMATLTREEQLALYALVKKMQLGIIEVRALPAGKED